MDSDLEEEISELILDAQNNVTLESVSDDVEIKKESASRRLPEQWTRVVSM